MRGWRTRAMRAGAVLLPLAVAACQSFHRSCGPDGCDAGPAPLATEPRLPHEPTMHALACDLDHLEKHVDWYGSVVAKVPDVWGQARLTQHREEFEAQMKLDLSRFRETLQGSLARADQSFFQQSVALSAAVSGGVATTRIPPGVSSAAASSPQSTTQQVLVSPAAIDETALPGVVKDIEGKTDFFTPFKPPRPNLVGFAPGKDGEPGTLNISIEPTLYLAQKKRYLDFLNQIRRENEGDDTADSPGYSLNLVRVPVSVLPGKRTDVGYGAEVTMTLNPVLGDDLLPMTFRNLVVNDLTKQLGFPVTRMLSDQDKTLADLLTPEFEKFIQVVTQLSDYLDIGPPGRAESLARWVVNGPTPEARAWRDGFYKYATDEMKAALHDLATPAGQPPAGKPAAPTGPVKSSPGPGQPTAEQRAKRQFTPLNVRQVVAARVTHFPTAFNVPTIAFSNGLDNKTAFPTSQIIDVYGTQAVFNVLFGAQRAFKRSIDLQGYAHLPDIQSYLREEATAAYAFLRQNPDLMAHYCTPQLVQAIRSRRDEEVLAVRQHYRAAAAARTGFDPAFLTDPSAPVREPHHLEVTASLAWCLIVDSALLTDRLVRDMKEAATSKGKCLPGCEHWLPYFLPDPPPDARAAFNQYVALRWPIHVFALDPDTQDQNLADSLLTRRETQLALSMAFAGGQINARTLTRYARRLEAQYDTIALNRTQVGFGHGENVFGWRFYPRFQTPDTEGNLTVLARDQLVGGPTRNALLRQRRLEPGPRECVAVVLMPSFVPYATLDVWGNWFGLANPKHKVLDHTQALHLSRTVQAIRTGGCGVTDAGKYRDGDFERLLRRAEQLEARLPSQTMHFPAPVLNTLGGFEMFSNGTTDLAPELYGFYGAPGVAADKPTTLFLVGDHFSPLRTRVIVGNQAVPTVADIPTEATAAGTTEVRQRMLSRQVMQVTIAATAEKPLQTVTDRDRGRKYVTAHVATPYGVTRELLIPVVGAAPAPAPAPAAKAAEKPPEGYAFGADALTLPYCKKPAGDGKFRLWRHGELPEATALAITWADALGTAPREIENVTFEFRYKDCPFRIVVPDPVRAVGRVYPVNSRQLTAVLDALLDRYNGFGPFTDETNPLKDGVRVTGVTVTPVERDENKRQQRAVVVTPVGGELTLRFTGSICDDKAVAPGAPKQEPGKDVPKESGKEKKDGDSGVWWPDEPTPLLPLPTAPLPALPPLPRP